MSTEENPIPDGEKIVSQFEDECKFGFAKSLRRALTGAFDSHANPEGYPIGITTDRVFVAGLSIGRARPSESPVTAQVYQSIGDEEFEKLSTRLSLRSIPSPEVHEELEGNSSYVSETFRRVLHNAWANRDSELDELSLDQLLEEILRQPSCPSLEFLFDKTDITWGKVVAQWNESNAPLVKPRGRGGSSEGKSLEEALGGNPSKSRETPIRSVSATSSVSQSEEAVDGPASRELNPSAKEELTKFWNQIAIRPGNALTEALAYVSAQNGSLPPFVTPGQLMIGLLQLGEYTLDNYPDDDQRVEVILAKILRDRNQTISNLWSIPFLDGTGKNSVSRISKTLRMVFQLAAQLEEQCSPGSAYVAPRHFVAAIVHLIKKSEFPFPEEIAPLTSDDLKKALDTHIAHTPDDDNIEAWNDFFANGVAGTELVRDSGPAGTLAEYERDGTNAMLGGDGRKYARAIASTFLSAGNGDFCFGLFGPWGRGKSTLITQVSEELEDKFETVTFNAWKYPSRPAVWVSLYETIKQAASAGSWLKKAKLGLQCRLRLDDGLPLVVPGLLLLFSAFSKWSLVSWAIPIPKEWLLNDSSSIFTLEFWAASLDLIVAVVSVVLIVLYGKKMWGGFGTTLKSFVDLPDHGKHLGLQAAVGDDLRRLVETWARAKPNVSKPKVTKAKVTKPEMNLWGKVCGICRELASKIWRKSDAKADEEVLQERNTLPDSGLKSVGYLALAHKGFSIGFIFMWTSVGVLTCRIWDVAPLLFLCLLGGVFVLSIVAYFVLLWPINQARQILLVVDDLDRCPPDEMLAVVESLRVFLDDSQISPHLKVAMLLDREILAHAICRKHRRLLMKGQDGPSGRFTNATLIEEQIEKYFLLSFDLPPLGLDDAWNIAATIVGVSAEDAKGMKEAQGLKSADTSQKSESVTLPNADEQEGSESVPSSSAAAPQETQNDSSNAPISNGENEEKAVQEVHLSDTEKGNMLKLLTTYSTSGDDHITPRRMRMTKMRYFLARQILRELNEDPNPTELMEHFRDLSNDRKLDARLAQVVGMVTGITPE